MIFMEGEGEGREWILCRYCRVFNRAGTVYGVTARSKEVKNESFRKLNSSAGDGSLGHSYQIFYITIHERVEF